MNQELTGVLSLEEWEVGGVRCCCVGCGREGCEAVAWRGEPGVGYMDDSGHGEHGAYSWYSFPRVRFQCLHCMSEKGLTVNILAL